MKLEFFANMVRGVVRITFCAALFTCLSAVSLTCSANERTTGESLHTHIDAAIDRLGSTDFLDRESATRELMQRGSIAIPDLEKALPTAKGEIRYRIRSILAHQRRSSDQTTKRAAEKAIARIATSRDRASAAWARSILPLPSKPMESPVALQSPADKQG
jgi:hypothetical protein